MNEEILDKQIIIIDSNEGFFSDNNKYDFYIDIYTPIKDACLIKILESSLIVTDLYKDANEPTDKGKLNGNEILNNDNIYINVNNYNRIITTNKTNHSSSSYFDLITVDRTKYIQEYFVKASNQASVVTIDYNIKNDHVTDDASFIINPIDPSLKRFNIILYDKNNTILNKTNTKRFIMKLCIYHNRKKLTHG